MAFDIGNDGNTINLTRGDTATFKVPYFWKDSHDEYTPQSGDTLTFTIRRKSDTDILLQKIFKGTNIIRLEPEDTNQLDMDKTYTYDVQLNTVSGEVSTYGPHKIKILKENTY